MASDASTEPCVWISTTVNSINDIQADLRKEFGDDWARGRPSEDREWASRMIDESGGWKRGEILTKEQIGDLWYFNAHPE